MHLIFYDLKIYGISSAEIYWFMNTEEIFISHIVSLIDTLKIINIYFKAILINT